MRSAHENFGYGLFSFILASAVVNCQLTCVCLVLLDWFQASVFRHIVSSSGIFSDKHCLLSALSSISAMLSQFPCLGVKWISRRSANRNAAAVSGGIFQYLLR